MDKEELEHFKKLFGEIDIYTQSDVYRWFRSFPELTTDENCVIMGRTPHVIERLKRWCGLTSIKFAETYDMTLYSRPLYNKDRVYKKYFIDPLEWDEKEITNKYINRSSSIRGLARQYGCSFNKIKLLLKKKKIRLRSHSDAVKTHNPYCNYSWLHNAYINKRFSLRKCARIVGVSTATIRHWFIKYGISTRTYIELGKE